MNPFSTDAMLGAIRTLKRPKSFLLDTAFTRVQTEELEEIHFDVQVYKRRVAPFVSPSAQGKIVEHQGYDTQTFRPASVKPKTVFRPRKALKRAMGERLGGGDYTAAQRRDMAIAEILFDHVDQITRRQEIMAASALRTGTVSVSGENYPEVTVNFGRDASLTAALAGTDKWSDPSSTPLDDLDNMAEIVHEVEGASIADVVMDPQAYKAFKRNAQVKEVLDIRRAAGANTLELGGTDLAKGAQFVGVFGSFRVWVYSEFYEDENGNTHPLLPAGTVIGLSPDLEGVRAFGAIEDEEADVAALQYFPKSWLEHDPSVRIIMTQSAPLTVLTRPNGSFCITVL